MTDDNARASHLSPEDIKLMQAKNHAEYRAQRSASGWPTLTHEDRVRVLLGWIVTFTGIVALATVLSLVTGVVLALQQ